MTPVGPGTLEASRGWCLSRVPRRPFLEGRPARVRRMLLTRAWSGVPVSPAHRAQAATAISAQRLHGKRETRLGLQQRVQVENAVPIGIGLEIVGCQLVLLAPSCRARNEPGTDLRLYLDRVGPEAAPAMLWHRGSQPAAHQNRIFILLQEQRQVVERPGGVLKRVGKRLRSLDPEPLLGNVGHVYQHRQNIL